VWATIDVGGCVNSSLSSCNGWLDVCETPSVQNLHHLEIVRCSSGDGSTPYPIQSWTVTSSEENQPVHLPIVAFIYLHPIPSQILKPDKNIYIPPKHRPNETNPPPIMKPTTLLNLLLTTATTLALPNRPKSRTHPRPLNPRPLEQRSLRPRRRRLPL
jgi:hypothetical protein